MSDIPVDKFFCFTETSKMMKEQYYFDAIKRRHPFFTTRQINKIVKKVLSNEDWIREKLNYSNSIDEGHLFTWALDLYEYERDLRLHSNLDDFDIDQRVLDRVNSLPDM